ncbi:DEAD/DEAH box helicase [Gulosibacter sp. 10]|uniref:DEAD/DEAH box helicase n=1 Tax=Gulosibacter sp. 10 TaxID=1255570 RepID=UPI00097F26A5|nr:DEAD/DEAH box helicase [Gulosibacter sp. 10]SJM53003.1 DNA or RNA helicases of superfamily II [Gulosibacter sp. 10]
MSTAQTGSNRSAHQVGTYAAEHLSPAFPQRAPWGTAGSLRAWQQEALALYLERQPRDFLASATPGAGKTTFALRLATELLADSTVNRVIVVAPTDHLKTQWAEAAARVGIRLDPRFSNAQGGISREYHGVAVTYAQVAMKPYVHEHLCGSARTLVIMDEIHHGGDSLSWGDALRDAYEHADRRLALTGTPFRSDTAPIPFVRYEPDSAGVRVSKADYTYGYGRALEDGVVRPVMFMAYAGDVRWRDTSGEEMSAGLGDDNTKDIVSQAWRTALDPKGEWMQQVLEAADRRLAEVREEVPDAGGLVIATDHQTARAYAKILEHLTGQKPAVILSDDKGASDRISEFSDSSERWMVAVRMVSEGVDVPRLAVGVYATSSSTPLFFAQAIGRFVRARRRGETATVFIPSVPKLSALAHELELERDHALDRKQGEGDDLGAGMTPEEKELAAAQKEEQASSELTEFAFEALSSEARFERVLYDGGDFGYAAEVGSLEELEYLGLPGLLEAEEVSALLEARAQKQEKIQDARARQQLDDGHRTVQPLHRSLKEQRSLLNSLVSVYARQQNLPHGKVHNELRRTCGGPAVGQATSHQIQQRIDLLRRRLH